ncbi:MarR family winged helix-turn-helix transcriptional regulator [Streptantibioticus ferralitis]|uniref:MarR family transcriptional regulator n=1 Tax=Streptantibioticus ferralitis TaxID=236510 RepID=A0ABT5Z2I3_9ACTN|nr:MarR family transcriptional regulator [Streptantibioticus ferralitis]MDF2258055.1 MarR family transcriptional regulator [Streptantibioticus ferralitis]
MMDDRIETAEHAWHGLRVLLLEQHDRRKEVAEALGMSFNRVKALRRIANQPCTLRSLAEFMVIDAPYATVIVDDLAKRGLVERTANPADRRSKLVRVTPPGRAAAEEGNRILDTPPDALLALPPDDLAALDRIVTRLLD